ncbi:hypothetical protein DRH27_00725 [Candidatus Falkowbacteria bacterium]|nr:MAG: hypothetical protein DRH27_00725 [Candidatus Falkowbacteria bacterium]
MTKKRLLFVVLIIFLAGSLFAFVNMGAVNADDAFKKFTDGYEKTGEKAGYEDTNLNKELPQVIGKIISAVLALLGIIFLFLIIYGGYIWMLARGNENDTKKAKDIITNAIIGLLVVVGAYAITFFVSNSLYEAPYNTYNNENEV